MILNVPSLMEAKFVISGLWLNETETVNSILNHLHVSEVIVLYYLFGQVRTNKLQAKEEMIMHLKQTVQEFEVEIE